MRRWVVTGPAGGGKSALCRFLAERGAALVNGDHLGHEILARPDIVAAIVKYIEANNISDRRVCMPDVDAAEPKAKP